MPLEALEIPTIETPRLILRGPREADFESMLAMWQHPEVTRHFHGHIRTREDQWGRFLRSLGMWALRGYGLFVAEEKGSGAFVGVVGAFEVRREMNPRIEDIPEAGWTLAAPFHGRGFATEAAKASIAWIESKLGYPEMFCIIAPANTPSIRVAEKCGFVPSYETIYDNQPTLVFRRPSHG